MDYKKFFNIAMLMSLMTSGSALAASFEEYVERLSSHPQVETLLSKSESTKSQAQGALGLPDPMLMIGVDNIPVSDPEFDRFLPTSKVIGFNQKIPNPILLRARSDKLEQLSEKQKLMADYTRARLQYMLIAKMAEYKSAKTRRGLIKKQLGFYKELEDTFQGQIESGRAVYQRFSEVDVERAEAERKLNDIDAQMASIEAVFIRLIDEIPQIDIPNIVNASWSGDPNAIYPVLIASQDINIAKKATEIADAAFLPNFGINAIYKQRQDGQNNSFSGEDWFSVQAQITVPLWASKNQKPKLKAAQDNKRSAEFAYDDMVRQWKAQMEAIRSARDSAASNVKILQEKDHAMAHKVKASQRNYEAGTEGLSRVLLARIDRLNIQAQLAQVRAMHISKAAEFNSNIVDGFTVAVLDAPKE